MGSATSSFTLIDRIKQGDRDAFTPLFEMYRARLAVLIHYRLGPQLRAEVEVNDLLQETLLKAFRDFDHFQYRGPGSFLHWLSRIADHIIIDAARFQGRNKRHATEMVPLRSDSQPQGAEPIDSRTPSRLLAQNEGLRQLLAMLEALPEQYRQVILLAKVEGLPTDEVAERLSRSRASTALLLHRALRRFREIRDAGVTP